MAVLPISHRRPSTVRVEDRYAAEQGQVFLSGVQALVRLLLDQRRADAAAGLRAGIMVSGYQGSPLGGFDREVARLSEPDIVHRPGVNEELGATAVWGSQMASSLPGARYEGVLGVWYGKAPGVDRAADAIRHANFGGTDPRGGVLALCGDDPASKSSTLPSASESLLAALEVPVFAPGTVQEALDLGHHAIACSRASGLWSALKIATEVADATAAIEVGAHRVTPRMPVMEWEGAPYVHRPSSNLLAAASLELERTLREIRLPLALRYAQLNDLNRIVVEAPRARLGVVAAGTAAHQTLQALRDLDLHDVRVLQIGMPFPLDGAKVREFALGLDEVLVLEDKGPFLERLVKDALYGTAAAPLVTGERDDRGERLVPSTGALTPDKIARAVGRRVLAHEDSAAVRDRLERLDRVVSVPDIGAVRAPHFCSGCPHNSSTQAADDQLVGAGIGCHTMVMLGAAANQGDVRGLTQMGGEGAQWIGAAPFLEPRHFVQNLGDGTLHHSGSLAIRAAIAADLHVTYKILYNSTVAMTGGQDVPGQMAVPELVRSLEAEGVKRIIITADDPSRYEGVTLPPLVEVRPRKSLRRSQKDLAAIAGVTVLIHDQACATELRRARKRGKAVTPPQAIHINERVCEGCGDCGEKSGCLSVEPVETEFGRKTRIHQSSCNKDFSCLEGDCPSFLEVIAPKAARKAPPEAPAMAEPELTAASEVRVRLVGIGGTGVVTVSQVLGMAAMLDGRPVGGLDMTGLSQKAGPVASDVRIGGEARRAQPLGRRHRRPAGARHRRHRDGPAPGDDRRGADARGGLDERRADRPRWSLDPRAASPDLAVAQAGISAATRGGVFFDAQALALALFGDHMPANVMVLGAAWQQGAIPLSLGAIRQAFELNGVAVEQNLAAFDWGRAVVAAPEAVDRILAPAEVVRELTKAERALVDGLAPEAGELRRLLEIRIPDLVGWGGIAAASRYAEALTRVRTLGDDALVEAVARGLLQADRLQGRVRGRAPAPRGPEGPARGREGQVPPAPAGAARAGHGPQAQARRLVRSGVPGAARGAAAARHSARSLRPRRGAPRRAGAAGRVPRARRGARAARGPETALAVAELPDMVRGYEDIKLANVERFRTRAAELLA